MAEPRAFVSFDFDHDGTSRLLFVGQAKKDSPTPFTVEDWSSKYELPESKWEAEVKAKIGKCARFVAEQAVQLHGAMGVTEELDIGLYFKRLLAFDTLFGGSAHHYRRHAALGGRTHA